MYGLFLEHVHSIVKQGLWAELLRDRKFFFPVGQPAPPGPAPAQPAAWVAAGDTTAISMNSELPFVGEHSVQVTLHPKSPHGIAQGGLHLQSGQYAARLVLSGNSTIDVRIRLVWGNGSIDHDEVTISEVSPEYRTYHVSLSSRGPSTDGRLEITATGKGRLLLGAVSLMPADNLHGFRRDVIELLRQLDSGIYRWGGNFVSGYDWRLGVGPRDERPPTWDPAWDSLEENDFGTAEFLALCNLIGVEPYLTVNAGFGDARSAADWVQYVNGNVATPMGALRAQHGHTAPFKVTWWNVGNEMYGRWQLGHIPLAQYVPKHNRLAAYMRAVDPSIRLVASGGDLSTMTVTRSAWHLIRNVQALPGSGADWTGGLLEHSINHLDAMSEHFYSQTDRSFDLARGEYVPTDDRPLDWTRRLANRVKLKVESYAAYRARLPALQEEHVPIWLDEWGFIDVWVHFRPTFGITMALARGLHELFRHTDVFDMAAYTLATSTLSFSEHEAMLNTNGLMFKMYRQHFGVVPVVVDGNSQQPPPTRPIGGDQPKVNAGGDLFPLDVVASLTEERDTLAVAVVNPTESVQQVALALRGTGAYGPVSNWTMHGDLGSRNVVGYPQEIPIDTATLATWPDRFTAAPNSINLYRVSLRQTAR